METKLDLVFRGVKEDCVVRFFVLLIQPIYAKIAKNLISHRF